MEPTTQMTYGQKAVGLTFNPSGDENVQKIKQLYAEIIDICDGIRTGAPLYTEMNLLSERGNLLTEAIRQAQTAQMWAVKGITYKL